MSGPVWTDGRISELRDHTAAGLSASTIADIMGVSKNAVISAWHRHHVVPKAPCVPRPRPEKTANGSEQRRIAGERHSAAMRPTRHLTPAKAPPPSPSHAQSFQERLAAAFDPANAPPSARLLPLEELQPGLCKWPLYHDGPGCFCGAPVTAFGLDGRPVVYCEHHAAMAVPPKMQEVGHGHKR